MVSDVLSDACDQIDRYLSEPNSGYTGAMLLEIVAIRLLMDQARLRLDTAPCRPDCEHHSQGPGHGCIDSAGIDRHCRREGMKVSAWLNVAPEQCQQDEAEETWKRMLLGKVPGLK